MDDSQLDPEKRTSVTIRRAPKLPVFAVVGALVGFLAALFLTGAFEVDPTIGIAATFGYLALYAIPLGVVLGVVVALLLDGRASRRSTEVIAGKLDVSSVDAAGADAHDEGDANGDDISEQNSSS